MSVLLKALSSQGLWSDFSFLEEEGVLGIFVLTMKGQIGDCHEMLMVQQRRWVPPGPPEPLLLPLKLLDF